MGKAREAALQCSRAVTQQTSKLPDLPESLSLQNIYFITQTYALTMGDASCCQKALILHRSIGMHVWGGGGWVGGGWCYYLLSLILTTTSTPLPVLGFKNNSRRMFQVKRRFFRVDLTQ